MEQNEEKESGDKLTVSFVSCVLETASERPLHTRPPAAAAHTYTPIKY